LVVEAPIIAHPARVNGVVLTRFVAINLLLTRPNDDIATSGAACTDALRFLEKPNAHFESKVFGRERTNGTKVHRVEGVIIVELLSRMRSQRAIATALCKTERVISYDVFAKANATRTENATLVIQHDTGSEINLLWLVNLVLYEAAFVLTVLD